MYLQLRILAAFTFFLALLAFSLNFNTNYAHQQTTSKPSPIPEPSSQQGCQPRRNRNCPNPNLPPRAPVVRLTALPSSIALPCASNERSATCTPSTDQRIQLTTTATDPDGDTLSYVYPQPSGGRIEGEGPNVVWNLEGVPPGEYTAKVQVSDGCGCVTESSVTVFVSLCPDCLPEVRPCPQLNITAPDIMTAGEPVTFTVSVSGLPPGEVPTYQWTVTGGRIVSGDGTSEVTVAVSEDVGQMIRVGVGLVGDFSCQPVATAEVQVARPSRVPGDPISITGTVTSSNGVALERARVMAVSTTTNFSKSAETDTSGRYQLVGLPNGRYRVTSSAARHRTSQPQQADVRAGQPVTLDFELRRR